MRSWYQVGRPSMFDGNTFFGATGMPIEKIARVSTRLADWLPEPFTVAAWNVRSLMVGPGVMAGVEWYDCCPCWRLQPPVPFPYSGIPLNSPLFRRALRRGPRAG